MRLLALGTRLRGGSKQTGPAPFLHSTAEASDEVLAVLYRQQEMHKLYGDVVHLNDK